MSSDMTRKEQSEFADDEQESNLPIYRGPNGTKVILNSGSNVPSGLMKVGAKRKTKKSKRRVHKKRSLLKSRKVR